jgi:hypothetical protein
MDVDEIFASTTPFNTITGAHTSGPVVLTYSPQFNALAFYSVQDFLTGTLGGTTSGITSGAVQTQAGATPLTTYLNLVSTNAAAGNGVLLPPSSQGAEAVIVNATANALQVYGTAPDTINGVATATGISQQANSIATYRCLVTGNWISAPAANYTGALPQASVANGLTAHAGGGQGSALALTASINRVTTVATAADSVSLPPSLPGLAITVINAAAANSLNVFPVSGDAINALSANTAFAMAANKTATFYCAVAGTWNSNLTA